MPAQSVPRDQWERFFAELNERFHRKLATIASLTPGAEPQILAFDATFEAIRAEQTGDDALLTISYNDGITHTISAPLQIHISPFARGAGQIVTIEAAAAPATRLYLTTGGKAVGGRGARG